MDLYQTAMDVSTSLWLFDISGNWSHILSRHHQYKQFNNCTSGSTLHLSTTALCGCPIIAKTSRLIAPSIQHNNIHWIKLGCYSGEGACGEGCIQNISVGILQSRIILESFVFVVAIIRQCRTSLEVQHSARHLRFINQLSAPRRENVLSVLHTHTRGDCAQ